MPLSRSLIDLKESIRQATLPAVARFKTETGTMPERIEIQMVDSDTFASGPLPERIVGEIRIYMGEF